MQLFAPLQNFRSSTPLPVLAAAAQPCQPRPSDAGPCGWFDSTLDLRSGLEISEQDCDTLYQLWELATH